MEILASAGVGGRGFQEKFIIISTILLGLNVLIFILLFSIVFIELWFY